MLRQLVLCTSLSLVPLTTEAAFTDFEDLALNETFVVGDRIDSREISLDVTELFPLDTSVLVSGSGSVNGSPRQLSLRGRALNFRLPSNTELISLFFNTNNAPSSTIINGIGTRLANNFNNLDGSSVEGVSISVDVLPTSGGNIGKLTLSGPINRFYIGGQDLEIDDVTITVPEPTSLVLFGCVGLLMLTCYRHTP